MLGRPDSLVAEALIGASEELRALNPSTGDVLHAMAGVTWGSGGDASEDVPQPPFNPKVRDLVSQVCERRGHPFLVARNLPHLKMNDGPPGEKGYQLVPTRQGVPEGLCVQGVDGKTALALIAALKELL